MGRNILCLILLFTISTSFGQAKKEWKAGYTLSVVDFEAEPPPLAGGPGFYLAAQLDFNNAKNVSAGNKRVVPHVTTYFYPGLSWLQQGEGTETWLKLAQMDFDLLELFARKYRQRLYRRINVFSDLKIRKDIQKEINTEIAQWQVEMHMAQAESGGKRDAFHEKVLKEITALDKYCKQCDPNQKIK